jgi:hypothetical protein
MVTSACTRTYEHTREQIPRRANTLPEELGSTNGDPVELADELFRVSAMSARDIQTYCDHTESNRLTGIVQINSGKMWGEFCVVDYLMGTTLPCAWIEMDRDMREVLLVARFGGETIN